MEQADHLLTGGGRPVERNRRAMCRGGLLGCETVVGGFVDRRNRGTRAEPNT